MATQRMQVDNTAFLIEKLASDCAPLQFVRELTSNSIQAIQARQSAGWVGNGVIVWDVDWALVTQSNVYKLQISDNGTGMTGPQIEQYINQLSSSGRVQDRAMNFGLGAKITGCVSNPAGLLYKSWVDGVGVMASLWKDPVEGYGLRQLALGDATFAHYARLSDEAKPESMGTDDCGTAVVLMGKDEAADNTFMPPALPNKWLVKYLNDRYFEFPDGIKVKVRNFQRTERQGWPSLSTQKMGEEAGSQMREIQGMRANLDRAAPDKGVVQLEDAKVHWWLLPEDEVRQRDIWESTGHCAALYQGELYDFLRGQSAKCRLRDFGIVFGTTRVVLYVEPEERLLKVYANTARSVLLADGERLPWESWAARFREQMPTEIGDMMEGIGSKSGEKDHRESIRKRLKEMKDLMKMSRYKRSSTGSMSVGGELPGGEAGEPSPRRRQSAGASGTRGGSVGNLYAAFIKADGEQGELISARQDIPEPKWLSLADGSREKDDLEDRAARYLRQQNMIQINADFRIFSDLLKYCSAQYNQLSDPNSDAHIRDVVNEAIELQLVEAVVGVLSLQGSLEWGADKIEAALSEEALTTAVLPRYTMLKTINRILGAKLGRKQTADE